MTRIRSSSTQVMTESVPLPEEACLAIADRVVACYRSLRALADEKRRAVEAFGRRQEALEREMADLSRRMDQGNVETVLACPVEYDVEGRLKVLVHPETGVVMDVQPMTESDMADLRAQGLVE